MDFSLCSRRSSVAGRTARILADVMPPKTVDRGPTTDVNRSAQGKLDINCGWIGHRLQKSTLCIAVYGFLMRDCAVKQTPLNSKRLPYPRPSARAGLAPMRRHVSHSIATMAFSLARLIARGLPEYPCCGIKVNQRTRVY